MTSVWYLAGVLYVALSAVAFVVVYHRRAYWWETAVGVNIMLLAGFIAALHIVGFLNVLLGRPDWMRWVLWAFYLGIGTTLWWRLGLLIKAQREAHAQAKEHPDAH